jgi:hypothetical protein
VREQGQLNSSVHVDYFVAGIQSLIYTKKVATTISCQVRLTEPLVETTYWSYNTSFTHGERCGPLNQALPYTLAMGLAEQVGHALIDGDDPTGNVGFMADGIMFAAFQPQPGYGSLDQIITQSFQAAAQTAYSVIPVALNSTTIRAETSPTPVVVGFNAYVWASNRQRGVVWPVILTLAGLFMLTATWASLAKHIRYDPSDWMQTVCIALGSSMSPPSGSCTGHLDISRRTFNFCYGVESPGHLDFCRSHRHRIPARGMVRRIRKQHGEPWH